MYSLLFDAIENFLIFKLFSRRWTYDINLLSYLLRLTLMNVQNRIALLLSLVWIPHWMKVRMFVFIYLPMSLVLRFICKMSSLQSFLFQLFLHGGQHSTLLTIILVCTMYTLAQMIIMCSTCDVIYCKQNTLLKLLKHSSLVFTGEMVLSGLMYLLSGVRTLVSILLLDVLL